MGVTFIGVPLTLEAMVVAIAEATHHISQMNLCLILMSKCINNDDYNDGDDDDDDDDDDSDDVSDVKV
jgi:hypothetical protein